MTSYYVGSRKYDSGPYKWKPILKLKERIRKRDRHTCRRCGQKWQPGEPRLHVHRIVPEIQGGGYSYVNCVSVCADCHLTIHTESPRNLFFLRDAPKIDPWYGR